jgi:hypothetical protein
MQNGEHAIMVCPNGQAWEWRLVDVEGATFATGAALTQEAAMMSAWAAAKLRSPFSRVFPRSSAARPRTAMPGIGN